MRTLHGLFFSWLKMTILETSSNPDSDDLRKALKKRRAQIPVIERTMAGNRVWRHLQHWPPLQHAKRVACYLSTLDEFPTERIIKGLLASGKEVYVPVVHASNKYRMIFQRYRPGVPMWRNRFGIEEPIPNRREQIAGGQLDLVLLPLLGFDHCGTRMGLGGGFYDRHFAFRLPPWRTKKPWLVGLGFDAQQCSSLVRNAWDVPLDAVVTESGIRVFR